jgi:sugar (pentulose or hexulose) kinase
LGIDIGTQGLSIIVTSTDASSASLPVLATGTGSYEMIPNLPDGCYEQHTDNWDRALQQAMDQIRQQIPNLQILAIGISGQMHGQVLCGSGGSSSSSEDDNDDGGDDGDDNNNNNSSSSIIIPLGTVRLWCDARNDDEGIELTQLFQTKVPKRSTMVMDDTESTRTSVTCPTHDYTGRLDLVSIDGRLDLGDWRCSGNVSYRSNHLEL